MTSIAEALQAGLEHHRAGRLQQAELMYRHVLQIHPRHAGAVHLLGLIAFQAGKVDIAENLLSEAVKIDAFHAQYWADLGEVYRAVGKIPEAIKVYRKAIELHPDMANAHNHLGTLLQTAGEMAEAEKSFREVLSHNPEHPEAAGNLAAALLAQGRLPEAKEAFELAIKNAPESASVYLGFGRCLQASGDLLGAIACFKKSGRLDPTSSMAHYCLGRAHQARGELNEAAAEYTQTIRMAPQFADAYYSMGILQRDAGRTTQAVSLFQAAARANPGMVKAHLCLANLYIVLGRPDEAVAASRAATELQPDSASAAAHLAAACQIQGDLAGTIAAFRRAIQLAPDDVTSFSSLIYSMNFDPACSAEQIFAEHLEWARRFAEPHTAAAKPHANDRSPDRRLRIGYVSAHFREHAVSFFSLPMLAAHDHEGFEIFCYSNALEAEADGITREFKKSADVWRDVAGLSDEALAELIREDQIDILVDLTGHIRGSRLTALARKPAPVQVTYLGYQNTTGMSAMDYRVSDSHANPRGMSDAFYTERLVLLPRSFFCFRSSDDAPEVNELPALLAGHVTFGWFNYIAKTTPEAIDSWVRILSAAPHSRLLVLGYRGGVFEERIREVVKAAGIDPDRVEVLDHCRPNEYLQLHHRIDIALDAFPFNGHTTVCNALWMGVPSVVREGSSYASRFGGTALLNLGLADLIAKSSDEYVEIAARLAGDLDRLAELRRTLRGRMAASPLLDSAGFARIVEKAYRTMWRKWCQVD